jgi:hypothetical protein
MKTAQMNHPSSTLGEFGLAMTFFLFILSKVTTNEIVMGVTIANGCIAILINIPKLVSVYKKHIKPIFGRKV